ncbi:hypothetical protein ES705_23140 [subsurface metagenome]
MVIIEELYQRGAKIKAFNPQVMEEAKKIKRNNIL